IKGRLAKYGRSQDDQALVTGIAVYVGHTAREAHDKYREIQSLSVTNYDLTNLQAALGVDLSAYKLDTGVSEIEELAEASVNAQRIVEQAKSSFGSDQITLKDVFLYF